MKKYIIILSCILVSAIFIIGCKDNSIQESNATDSNIKEIALKEANKIAKEQGYTIKPETYDEIMCGDAMIYKLMKNACVEGGYSLDEIDSDAENRKIVGFELVEKSKIEDGMIALYLFINNDKATGAWLDYSGYVPGIEPINFKENFK